MIVATGDTSRIERRIVQVTGFGYFRIANGHHTWHPKTADIGTIPQRSELLTRFGKVLFGERRVKHTMRGQFVSIRVNALSQILRQ